MATDPTVLNAIRAAVEQDPDNTALRLHLGTLLLEAQDPKGALEQFAYILGKQPAHLEALKRAGEAADAAGDPIRADGYRRLYEALSWNQARNMISGIEEPPPGDFPPPPPSVSSLSGSDDWNEQDEEAEDEDEEPKRGRLRDSYGDGDAEEGRWEAERPEVTLADVAGMDEVKRRLNVAFLAPMRNPDMMKLYGKSLKGGLLLYGPPGCGKTFIARAAAGELGAKFLSIGLSDVLDMYIGQSERNLHEIFETARGNRPCVLFFDEIDALGRKRSLMREAAGRTAVNQLLAELDSVSGNNDGVFVLAATNHPWDVDTALRRPGRLDRTLLVLPPDGPAREVILRYHSKGRPLDNVDFVWLAQNTEGYSGADLAHLCESAAEMAMEESILSGNTRPIRMNDYRKALKEVKPSTHPWFDTARNYALFANEGGAYDDLLKYLRARKML